MEQDKPSGRIIFGTLPRAGESHTDFRERVLQVQAEASARRQHDLQEQSSPQNDASARIRIWERLHQIDLPRSPSHPLIAVIAANTGLSADEVLAEQHLRLSGAASVQPAAPKLPPETP